MNYKISILGMGYVGCANALMLARNNTVSICEIDEKKVLNFNEGLLPIEESNAQEFLDKQELNISATTNLNESSSRLQFYYHRITNKF